VYFGCELWNLDWKLQLSLILIVVGVATKAFIFSTMLFWYPRLTLVPALLVLPFLYLHPNTWLIPLQGIADAFASPTSLARAMSRYLDPKQLRRFCIAMLFVPTFLEMRTIHFLSQIQQHQRAGTTSRWELLNAGVIVVSFGILYRSYCQRRVSPQDCRHRCLLVLYGSALVRVAMAWDVWNLPLLLAPFCTATGVLLLVSHEDDEWLSRAVRMALRRTLRDVLANVSEGVQQDEMLQLAMLRWIVDYWSNTTTAAPPPSSNNSHPPNGSATSSTASSLTPASLEPSSQRQPDVQWTELLPMLTMTTDQMATEVETLQQHHPRPQRSASQSAASMGSDYSSQISGRPAARRTASASSFPEQSNGTNPAESSVSSVYNLQSMLSGMDVDEHAKPAVLAYQEMINDFPPPHIVAILVSVARRCPALLVLIMHVISPRALTTSLSSSLILVPLIVMELLRIREWSDSCQRVQALMRNKSEGVTNDTRQDEGASLWMNRDGSTIDSMVLLVSGDRLCTYRPPSLLVVWMNIRSSVSALKVGLTAVRCAHTTAVAVDFCGNLLSLASLGVEVSQFGWLHGLAIVAKEVIALHSSSTTSRDTRYTSAALNAVSNSRKMSRNVRVLLEEENNVVNQLLGPTLGVLSVVIGRGWIWGREEHRPPVVASTVRIEELDNSETSADAVETPLQVANESREPSPGKRCANSLDETPLAPLSTAAVELNKILGKPNLADEKAEKDEQDKSKKAASVVEAVDTNVFEVKLREKVISKEANDVQDTRSKLLSEFMELVSSCAESSIIDDVRIYCW